MAEYWPPLGAIEITLLPREDGGLRICSTSHPGLILSGSDPDQVIAQVWPALKALDKYKRDHPVAFAK